MSLFKKEITTRGYEPDRTATIGIVRILNYLEQLRWEFIQSPEAGLIDHLASGHFPVLRSQRIEIIQRVGMDTKLSLHARIRKVGRNIVSIEHHILDARDQSLVAHAIVDGIFLGPNRRPVRIPEGFRALAKHHHELGHPEHTIAAPHQPRADGPLIHTNPERAVYTPIGFETFTHPEAPVEVPFEWPLKVRPSQIDIFSHVNAATYVEMFNDALFESAHADTEVFKHLKNASLRRLAIHYQQEATVGQNLVVRLWPLGHVDEIGCELYRPEDGATLCLATLHLSHGLGAEQQAPYPESHDNQSDPKALA